MAGQPQAEVRITVSIPGEPQRDLILDYPLHPGHSDLLWEIHDHHGGDRLIECRMHDNDPRLADLRESDGRVRGIWMTLRAIGDAANPGRKRLVLCHWPNNPAGPGSHDVPRMMTCEHILGQEYIAERGQDCGYGVVVNRAFNTENLCRADVRVVGAEATLAAEIQVTRAATSNVLRRTQAAQRAGATSVWFPRMEGVPDWAFKVPAVSTNEVASTHPRTWTVTSGPRALEDERCVPGSWFEQCPLLGKGHCYRHHPRWVPMVLVDGGVTVDDIVERLPAGGLVRCDTGTRQGVILATPADRDRWISFRGEKGPGAAAAKRRDPSGRVRHSDYPARMIRERLERAPAVQPSSLAAAAGAEASLPPDDGWCSVWCRHPGLHWRRDGDGWVWRPELVGCAHPGHDEPGVPVWGISAVDLSDPVVHRVSSGREWFWCVVRGGRLAERGWDATARWAAQVGEGIAHGLDCGRVRRDRPVVRCGRVAAEGWRVLAHGEASEVSAA